MSGEAGGARILIVDDVDDMRMLIRRALTSRGYLVDVASTLADARTLGPHGYDAVVVDARLGRDRGTDLVQEMISEDPSAAARCLVITGGPTVPLPPGVSFLAKPFHPRDLLAAVRSLHTPGAGWDGGNGGRPAGSRLAAAVTAGSQPAARGTAGQPGPVATRPPAGRLLEMTRRLRAMEREQVLDYLHDGPVQEIAAATLTLHMMGSSVPPTMARQVTAARERLDEAARSLRLLIDGPSSSWAEAAPLARLLPERTAWLLAQPLTLNVSDPLAGLGGAMASAIADLAELMLLVMTAGEPPARATAAVDCDEHSITIDLTLSPAPQSEPPGGPQNEPPGGPPAGEPDSLSTPPDAPPLPSDDRYARSALVELAAALGATARTEFSARRQRGVMVVPRQSLA